MAMLIKKRRVNPETGKPGDYWLIQWKEGRRCKTSALGYLPKKEAEKALIIWHGKVAAGEAPQQLSGKSSGWKLADVLADLAVQRRARGLSASTLEQDRYSVMALLRNLGENIQIGDLQGSTLDRYVLARRAEGVRSRTIQIELTHLRRALDLAVEDGHLERRPRMPQLRNTDAREVRWLTPEQQRPFLAHLPWGTAPGSAMALWLVLELGLRIGEATSRKWGHVRWAGAVLEVDAASVKTRTWREMPLAPPVLKRLREAYMLAGRDDDALICGGVQDVRSALRVVCRKAGVPYCNPHGLRHSWATRLALAGVDRPTLMALGGWQTGEMLDEVYAHAHPAHVREQVARTALG